MPSKRPPTRSKSSKPKHAPAQKPRPGKAASRHAPKPARTPPKPAARPRTKPAPSARLPATAAPADAKKGGRKGITIVTPKPVKKSGKSGGIQMPNLGGQLLRPGGPKRKPLIQSGPGAPALTSLASMSDTPRKTHLDKKQLARFEEILRRKRAELAGDVTTMETEALMSQSGSLSHLPQHMAEQGSDAYGQSLSLDLAAADRRLIKEIDDALKRIRDGSYGVCELTGKPIRAERLEELPWARYSIEAARELERRPRTP